MRLHLEEVGDAVLGCEVRQCARHLQWLGSRCFKFVVKGSVDGIRFTRVGSELNFDFLEGFFHICFLFD